MDGGPNKCLYHRHMTQKHVSQAGKGVEHIHRRALRHQHTKNHQ